MLDAFKEGQRHELADRAAHDARQREFRLFKQAYFVALGGLCTSDIPDKAHFAAMLAKDAVDELNQARDRILGPQVKETPK